MRAATARAAIRRGWVWPIMPAPPRPMERQIFGSWVVLPLPVSPQTTMTWWWSMTAASSSRLGGDGEVSGKVMAGRARAAVEGWRTRQFAPAGGQGRAGRGGTQAKEAAAGLVAHEGGFDQVFKGGHGREFYADSALTYTFHEDNLKERTARARADSVWSLAILHFTFCGNRDYYPSIWWWDSPCGKRLGTDMMRVFSTSRFPRVGIVQHPNAGTLLLHDPESKINIALLAVS